jgi:hypothetical protein
MTTSDDHPYQIGRGRPPLHSRFKPGQSGNPHGRPRRRQSFKMDDGRYLHSISGEGACINRFSPIAFAPWGRIIARR